MLNKIFNNFKNVNSVNKSHVRNIFKLFLFMFFFVTMFSISFSKSYARDKYTFTTTSGEKYIILVDTDGGTYEIVGTPYNNLTSVSKSDNTMIPGSSYYQVLANDYDNANNNEDKTRKKNRGQDIVNLLEFIAENLYVKGAKTGATFENELLDAPIVLKGNNGTHEWGGGTTKYDTMIVDKASDLPKQSPFYQNKERGRYSSYIKLNGEYAYDFLTNEVLLDCLTHCSDLSKYSWIKKELSDESIISDDDYELLLDLFSNTEIVQAKVVDKSSGDVVAIFELAKKKDNKKYKEETYVNNKKVVFYSTGDKVGLATSSNNDKDKERILYYELKNDKKQSLDEIYYKDGKITLPTCGAFVAIRNGSNDSINFYSVKYDADGKKANNTKYIGSISRNLYKDLLDEEAITVYDGDWIYDRQGTVIKVYKANEVDIDENAYFLDLSKAFICYLKGTYHFDVAIPTKKGIDKDFYSSIRKNGIDYVSFLGTEINNDNNGVKIHKEYKDDATYNAGYALRMYKEAMYDNKTKIYATIYQQTSKISKFGSHWKDDKLDLDQFDANSKNSNIPPSFPIKELVMVPKGTIIESGVGSSSGATISDTEAWENLIVDTSDVTIEFIAQLVKYGKIILILIIFIAIVIAGLNHMANGASNPKERAKLKVTIKNIIVGSIILICLTFIMILVITYVDKGLQFMPEYSVSIGDGYFENEDKIAQRGLILKLCELLLRAYNSIMNGVIEICEKQLAGSSEGIDYIKAIYDVYDPDGHVSSMKPFDDAGVEWTRVLSGYNVLVSVSLFLLLFTIVKTSFEYIISAGDEKKITKIKETWTRIFWAVILLVAVPYLIQLLIYFFNYMTAAVPVNFNDARFDLNIKFDGVLGAIAENIFITVKFQVFMAFLVRHVMLCVLTVSAPIVIAAWAISDKFKSFPLWFGELFTNIAMQFCYAVGFLIIILLSYTGENPVYGLILVSVALALSKFVKESLQGFFTQGAGIDEEGTAKSVVSMFFNWGNNIKKKTKQVGSLTEGLSNKLDPNGNTRAGRYASNVGKVLQGKYSKVKFSSTSKELRKKYNRAMHDLDDYPDAKDDAQDYYKDYKYAKENGKAFDKIQTDDPNDIHNIINDLVDAEYDEAHGKKAGLAYRYRRGKEALQDRNLERSISSSISNSHDGTIASAKDVENFRKYEESEKGDRGFATRVDSTGNVLDFSPDEIGEDQTTLSRLYQNRDSIEADDVRVIAQDVTEALGGDIAEAATLDAGAKAADLAHAEKVLANAQIANKLSLKGSEQQIVDALQSALAKQNAEKLKHVKINVDEGFVGKLYAMKMKALNKKIDDVDQGKS